eukprot:GHVP01038866.1.p1 GENE.GHVP01038866.1~~GHVP01038866.1.p1  ORF type:complete len:159 (+),score=22.33 GHVP01038866.1:26-478(+)
MEFFGKLSEELTNTFVRPHSNLFESDKEESGGVNFRASPVYDEEDSPSPVGELELQNMIKVLFDRVEWKDLQNRSKENFKLVEGPASVHLYLIPNGVDACDCAVPCSCSRQIGWLSMSPDFHDVVTWNGESKAKHVIYSKLKKWLDSPQS